MLINAVGVIRERGSQTFDALHRRAPVALFTAAAAAGVRRIVQISALGADPHARSRYHLTKKAADDFLLAQPVESVVVQPSLVFGPRGTSARLFTLLASLPLIPIAGRGDYEVQPIHLDDLTRAVVAVVEGREVPPRRIALVGPQPLRFTEFIAQLRRSMNFGKPRFVYIPRAIMRAGAYIAGAIPGSLLDRETLGMLLRSNTAAAADTRMLLGHDPRPVSAFIPPELSQLQRTSAQLRWWLPLLRGSVALVWIVTGIVSLGVYPLADSYALLARAGIPAGWIPTALYSAAFLNLAIGIATLALPKRRSLWLLQMAVIVTYTAIITVRLPQFWAHPYGPLLKNIPLLAVIGLLYSLERR